MTDEQLCEALVEAGILQKYKGISYLYWWGGSTNEDDIRLSAGVAVNSPEVAFRCLQHDSFYYAVEQDEHGVYINGKRYGRRADDRSLAYAVIQAFVSAQSDEGTGND